MAFNWIRKLFYRVNRKYKDRLFCTIFGKEKYKKYALQLYNAVNGSDYKDTSDLQIITLDDALYLKMKNDVAYLMINVIAVYEHQSTINPNMPVRGFMYSGELYSKYISLIDANIYGSKLVKLPTPQYVVFYNGTEDYPEKSELKLSDAFMTPVKMGTYEWTATVFNINPGKNKELMDKCQPLYGYSLLIDKFRTYSRSKGTIDAMNQAVDECIKGGYLTDVLKEQKAAAMLEAITSYNKKAYERDLREEGHEIGLKEGLEKGLKEGLEKGREEGREKGREEGREEMRLYYANEISAKNVLISQKEDQLSQKDREITRLKAELEKLTKK